MKRIAKWYNKVSLPVKASFWFLICSLVQRGISFLTVPIFTRMLSITEYGETVLYNSWLGIMTILATFQLATGVFNKAMVKYKDDRDGYASSILVLASLVTIVCALLYGVLAQVQGNIIDMPNCLSVMMFIDIFFSTALHIWSIRNRFEYKYRSIVVFTLMVSALGPLSSIVLIHFSGTSMQAEAQLFGMVAVKTIIYGILYIYILLRGKKLFNWEYWKYSINYNMPLIPHYLSQQVLTQSDRIMINSICGKSDAAIYGIAHQLSLASLVLTNAIHSSFTPWTYEKIARKEYRAIGEKSLMIEIGIGILCFLFSLFAPEMILILGGEQYMSAIWTVPAICMSVLFQTVYTFYGNIEFYFEKTKFVMIASLICAVCNLGLNAIFIPKFGFAAAGYTTLFCYIFYAAVHCIFMEKILKDEQIDSIYPEKKIWGLGAIFVALSLLASILYNYFILRYLMIAAISIGCVVAVKKGIVKGLFDRKTDIVSEDI